MRSFEPNNRKFKMNNDLHRQPRVAAPQVEKMESRELLAAPAMDALSQISVPAGKSILLPLHSTTSDNTAVSYTVTSSDPAVKTSVLSGGTYVKFSVSGYGDLTFKLFDTLTPDTVSKIKTLVQQGFYDGLTFHRVIKNFVTQGGDPAGNGSGGPGFSFADEFNANAIFTGTGQLAMANSGKDTNGSQFFITSGSQRALDFNHTIFGQLVQGFDVLDKIQNVPTDKNGLPATPVVISKAQVVQDNTDAVLLVQSPATVGTTQLAITATAADGQSSYQNVPVTTAADTVNDPPFLAPIADLSTRANTPLTFNIAATDLENDQLETQVVATSNADKVTITTNGAQVTITPKAGFTGTVPLLVGVRQVGATARGSTTSPWDTQAVSLSVNPPAVAANPVNNQVMEGQATGDRVVAWFADAENPAYTAANYGASIAWGDGSASIGTIRPRVGGGFEVVGNHTYTNEGTYATAVYIGDPAADGSAATVRAQAAGVYVATDAPLSAKGTNPADVVAGQSWSGVVATFTDASPLSPIANYSAIIRWGDGSIEKATSITKNAAGVMEVTGEHTYPSPGRKVAQVLIRDLGTSSTTAVTPIQIASANGLTPKPAPGTTTPTPTPSTPAPVTPVAPPVASSSPSTDGPLDPQTSGRLSAVSDSGVSYTDSITKVNSPQFDGQTAPGATVKLVANRVDVAGQAATVIGTATAGSDGKWSVTTASPLPDGQYAVAITVTRNTDSLTKTILGGGTGSGTPLVIDTTAPVISQIGYNRTTGQVRINAQDFGSGLNDAAWSSPGNYQFTAAAGRYNGQQINAQTFRMVSTKSFPQATYNIILDRGFGPRPQKIQVNVNAASLTDSAGNSATGVTSQTLGNSKIINQLPKGVAQTIQNSRKNTSILNQIVNMIIPTGARTKRF